jgi:hypothetical protein
MAGFVGTLVALAGIFWVAASAQAQIVLEDPEGLAFNYEGGPLWFESKPAKAMMSAGEFRRYDRALSSLDCPTAAQILNTAFIRTYPQYARARLKPDCSGDLDCFYWEHYAAVYFDEFGFCVSLRDFRERDRELREKNPKPPKFALKYDAKDYRYDDRLLEARDLSLSGIIGNVSSGYEPARKMIVRLLRRGDVFNAGPEVEYYLLRRGCVEEPDCSSSQDRLAELRAQIGPQRSAQIDAIVAAPKERRPILHKLLLGEKLEFAAPKERKGP